MSMTKGLFILACLAAIALQSSAKPQQQEKREQRYQLLKRQYDNVELPAEGRVLPSKLQALLSALNNNNQSPTSTSITDITASTSPTTSTGVTTTTGTSTPSTVAPAARSQGDYEDDEDMEHNSLDDFALELNEDAADDDEIEAIAGYAGVSSRNGQSGTRNALARQRQQFNRQNAQRRRRQRQNAQRRRRQRQQNQRRRQNLRRALQLINRLRQPRGGNRNSNRNRQINRRVIRIPI